MTTKKVIDLNSRDINLINLHSELLKLRDPLSLFIKQYDKEYLHYNNQAVIFLTKYLKIKKEKDKFK